MREAGRTARRISCVIVFGTLWGAVEITVGGLVHALHVPFGGLVLVAAAAAILAGQRRACPARGITLATGLLAAAIKVFSMGGVHPSPLLAVLVEALLAEGAFSLLGTGLVGSAAAGYLMGLWSLGQGLLSLLVLYGTDWFETAAAGWGRLWGPAAGAGPHVLPPAVLLLLGAALLALPGGAAGILGSWTSARIGPGTGGVLGGGENPRV